MKKTLLIITSLILLCIMVVGCQSTNATITTSNELNKNLNLLSNTVSRLDTVDNEYLVDNEIYTLESAANMPTQRRTYKNVLAQNKIKNYDQNITADHVSLNDELRKALSNELINRIYCDENGNCKLCNEKFICNDNNMCNSCNQTIICDSNGNCTSCGDVLYLDKNNNCNSCKNTCVSNTANSNISDSTKSCLQRISTNNNELSANLISTNINNNVDINDNINDVYDINYNTIDTNTTESNTQTNTNTYTNIDTTDNSTPKYQFIYYSENIDTPTLRYRPRFINNINYETANNSINNYVNKLQKLYTMTADVVEANNALANYKILILDNIDDTRELNDCVLTGTCTPNNNQILALNNYIEDLKSTVYNLRKCNGNLTNELNKISSTNTGISHSIDVTNSNYLRILNQIDTRISYHENAIATLEQIQYLLQDAQNNNQYTNTDTYVEDLNNNIINDNENIINDTNDDNTKNNIEDEIINSDDIIITDDAETNETNNDYILDEDINNTDNITDTSLNNDVIEGNDDNLNTNNDSIDDLSNVDNTYSNIDSYDNSINNLDTYDNEVINNNADITDETINNDNLNNATDIDNDNLNIDNNNIENTNNNLNNDSDIVNNNTTPEMVNGVADYNNNYNLNDNNRNTIISQNNLENTNDNVYHYDSDGSLYNNTNRYLDNLNNRDTNVNTYKYNTLVDSINRGTVDNGINNL